MTANDLYEIVKDVPREAWPRGVGYSNTLMAFEHAQEQTHTVFDDEHAELMFVGSMTAWLLRTCDRVETQSTPWGSVECTTCGEEHRVEASSLVAALAAACKEVAQ